MKSAGYYQKLFLIGAIWNWLATLPFMIGYRWILPLFNMELPTYPVFLILFLGLAFIFGIGYYLVSKDIHKNHDIVRLGIIGKLFVFSAFLWAGIAGQVAWPLVGAGVVDLVFAFLYMEFLVSFQIVETV